LLRTLTYNSRNVDESEAPSPVFVESFGSLILSYSLFLCY
jgi:hypothetical protein